MILFSLGFCVGAIVTATLLALYGQKVVLALLQKVSDEQQHKIDEANVRLDVLTAAQKRKSGSD